MTAARRNAKKEELVIPSIESLRAELAREEAICAFRRTLWNMAVALAAAVTVTVLVFTRLFALIRVDGSSMDPTLADGQLVILRRTEEIRTGDITGFYHNGRILLKRAIGSPGDEIEIDGEGNVYINGSMLEEPYVAEKSPGECELEFPCRVPEGMLFVLGDNRAVSIDSRSVSVGYVKQDQIVGRAVCRVWPVTGIEFWK